MSTCDFTRCTTLSPRQYVDLWFYLNGKEMLDTLLQQFLWICKLYDWKQTFTSETRSSVNAGGSGSENGRLSTLLHCTHLRKMFLAVCLPRMIQKRSLNAVNVLFTPLCNSAVVSFADYQIYGLMLPRRQHGSLAFLVKLVKRAFLNSSPASHNNLIVLVNTKLLHKDWNGWIFQGQEITNFCWKWLTLNGLSPQLFVKLDFFDLQIETFPNSWSSC